MRTRANTLCSLSVRIDCVSLGRCYAWQGHMRVRGCWVVVQQMQNPVKRGEVPSSAFQQLRASLVVQCASSCKNDGGTFYLFTHTFYNSNLRHQFKPYL